MKVELGGRRREFEKKRRNVAAKQETFKSRLFRQTRQADLSTAREEGYIKGETSENVRKRQERLRPSITGEN